MIEGCGPPAWHAEILFRMLQANLRHKSTWSSECTCMYVSYILFSNSLVRTRPALSRKIFSLWMAQAKLARPIFISTRAAPGPHQARTKGFLNEAAPSSGLNSLHGQRSHNSNELYTIELYRVQCTIPGPRRLKPVIPYWCYVAEFVNGSSLK